MADEGLSLRELVLEVRQDVKEMKEDRVTREEYDKMDTRVRGLEMKSWGVFGVGGAFGAVAGILAGFFGPN